MSGVRVRIRARVRVRVSFRIDYWVRVRGWTDDGRMRDE